MFTAFLQAVGLVSQPSWLWVLLTSWTTILLAVSSAAIYVAYRRFKVPKVKLFWPPGGASAAASPAVADLFATNPPAAAAAPPPAKTKKQLQEEAIVAEKERLATLKGTAMAKGLQDYLQLALKGTMGGDSAHLHTQTVF